MLGFYVASGHSNSGPQACTASSLSAEAPLQPRLYLVFTSPREHTVPGGWRLFGILYVSAFLWKSKAALAPHKF